jgi:predicted cytidylate kinase
MNNLEPIELSGIKNITISGRIGTGKTTLANHLAEKLNWQVLDGGKVFREIAKEMGISIIEKTKIPDSLDIEFENRVAKMLRTEKHHIIQSHLSGFVAQGIENVFKILVVCQDEDGEDKESIRIDRLINRDLISVADAKNEIHKREEEHLIKFKKLYVKNDPDWVYWDPKYYDLIINTYSLNREEALNFVLEKIGILKS